MQCAVSKDEHVQTETKTAAISIFGFKKKKNIYFFFLKTETEIVVSDEENRKPNRLSNFPTVASLIDMIYDK